MSQPGAQARTDVHGVQSENVVLKPAFLQYRDDYSSFINSRSDAIRVARVICIVAMCYVHIHVAAVDPTLKTLIRDILGRSSVPLLSVVSGLLMVGYFHRPFAQVVWLRFQSLIIPMMTWGLLGWSVLYVLGDTNQFSINDVIPVWATGKVPHLAFLRDLFVLMLATPVLISLIRRTYWAFPILVVIGLWAPIEPFLLRPQILPFYAFGIFWGIYRISAPRFINVLAFGLFLVTAAAILFLDYGGYIFDNLVLRPLSAWVFWLAALAIAHTNLKSKIILIEPAIFLLFLSHSTVGRILTGAYGKSGLHMDTLVWLAAPFICFAIAIIGKKILSSRVMPGLLSIGLSGK